MSTPGAEKARIGVLLVVGLASGLLVLHVVHLLGAGENLVTFLFGILVPMAFSLGVLAGGVWLRSSDLEGAHVLRASGWCLLGAAVLGLGAVFVVLYERAEGVAMSDPLFVVANAASAGAAVGFVVGVYDGRQRAARARMAAAQRRSERLSQQLTVLNRVLRHDLRNGAAAIQSHAELLAEDRGEDARVRTVRRKAAELVELGEQATTIEQTLQGTDAEREVVDLAAVVERALDRLERDHPEVDVRASLPADERVYAHPLIDTAVANVLENAVEHSDKRRPRIEVDLSRARRAGTEYVEMRIADDGPGIPEAEIAVLERGYETPLEHTSGLGLWLVNWIVTESGGDVRFERNDPAGSVVCLRFERARAAAGRRPRDDRPANRFHVVDSTPGGGPPRR